MKIKVKPEDFVVEEIIDLPISDSGPYTLLKLKKRYWNTLDAIDFVARKFSLSREKFSRAGLKDRYSLSTQYLTFRGDFKEIIKEKNFELMPVGKVSKPILPENLKGNRFSITMRDLSDEEIEKLRRNYTEVSSFGFPNYFDEQRFGSARHRHGFFAKLLMLGHYEGALKLLLCYPYKEDNKRLKIFKKYCAENWGDWDGCIKYTPIEFKRIILFLRENPRDFKDAIKKIDREMLNLYLLAYQSYLFNEVLYRIIKKIGSDTVEIPYSMGKFVFYRSLPNKKLLMDLKIPMLNDKTKLSDFTGEIISEVLKKEGIRLRDFKLSKMRFRKVRFKGFLRSAIILPEDFYIGEECTDEIYKNKRKILLRFILPPGSYATILIKRLMI
ncbi:MAG: tRNA pseudouridine(13) synthase TruD [candidate division WOR-3 bacterium]|nr:tRNA pseudouridine(13) synthase TruD [candidate division WOR-3 bacterium]